MKEAIAITSRWLFQGVPQLIGVSDRDISSVRFIRSVWDLHHILQKKKNVIDTVMGDISIEPDTDIMQELFNELHNI